MTRGALREIRLNVADQRDRIKGGLEEASVTQIPVVVSLMLCEKVIVESKTHNPTFINSFSTRVVRSIPSEPLTFMVCATLTNGQGNIPLEVRIDRLDTMETIRFRQGTATFDDPMVERRLSHTIRDLSFPVAGAYQVLLIAGNELIADRRFEIHHEIPEDDENE